MVSKVTKRVLVVEDQKELREVLALELKRAGYVVMTAEDGQAGLETVKKHDFDLILLDIVMPNMDGFKTLETMRAEKKKHPNSSTF